MNYKRFLVNSLLDKYERSLHSQGLGLSNRRVLLKTKELSEYDFRNLEIRDSFNHAVIELETQKIVLFKWLHGRKGSVIEEIWLNLEQVENAYLSIERESIGVQIKRYTDMFQTAIEQCKAEWITLFFSNQITILQSKKRLTQLCKYGLNAIQDLITALLEYDKLQGENMTMRAFSIQCFNNSKHFEQNVKELFLLVASKNEPTLIEALEEDELSWREQFALLGIFARCELYELSGKITIRTTLGNCDFYPMSRCGMAVPSTAINEIEHIDMRNIKSIIFIENKTCYDEYLIKRKRSDELVFFHGGFVSPQKKKFVQKIVDHSSPNSQFLFWGDIDMGGFRMFAQLSVYVPSLIPWNMGTKEVNAFSDKGLSRPKQYLETIEKLKQDDRFSMFQDAIDRILLYGVTIEQEVMLDTF